MNKYSLSFLLVTAISLPSICLAQTDSPYITPEQAINLANEPRQKVHNVTQKATKAELAGLNRSFNRIYAIQAKALGNKAPVISDEILNAKDTPQEVENKINAILQNNAKPEDFLHLMEPPALEDKTDTETDTDTDIEETPTPEDIQPAPTKENTPQTSGNIKEIIVEEEDDTTKHIFRRKVFTKQ